METRPPGFTHVRLQTSSPAELAAFYGEAWGLPFVLENDEVHLQAGSTKLTFGAGEPATYHFAFNVPENQIEEALDWISERTTPILDHGVPYFFESWNAHAFYFLDPAGNLGEFIARHTLPNASREPFGPASILSVSEVGFAVEDVHATAKELERTLGMRPYRPFLSDFGAVGDEHGLLILANKGRIWYGTQDMGAEAHPAAVKVAGLTPDSKGFAEGPYRIDPAP